MANNAEYFRSFSMYSDVLGAVSECVSTSLADKTSLNDAEKQENICVCHGISAPISKTNNLLCKTAKRRILPVHAFSPRFFFCIYSSVFILLWFLRTVFLRLPVPRLPQGLLRHLRLLPELGQNHRSLPDNPLHRKLLLFRGIHL